MNKIRMTAGIVVASALLGLAGCKSEVPLPAAVPAAPAAAEQVLGHEYSDSTDYWAEEPAAGAPEVVGILPKNIQNLLCNSVHHAREGHLDQAALKLDIAKNDKLVKLLDKGDITQEQYLELDNWMADLIELLNDDITAYPAVEQSFPFSCAGQDEESEAIGEVIELDVVDNVENANRFLQQVCYSTFAAEERDYVGAADYLINAELTGIDMLHDSDLDDAHKAELRAWLRELNSLLIFHPWDYLGLQIPFQCERYRPTYVPSGLVREIEQTLDEIWDAITFW